MKKILIAILLAMCSMSAYSATGPVTDTEGKPITDGNGGPVIYSN